MGIVAATAARRLQAETGSRPVRPIRSPIQSILLVKVIRVETLTMVTEGTDLVQVVRGPTTLTMMEVTEPLTEVKDEE